VRRILASLWHGEGLRHLPIAVRESDEPLVRLELHDSSATSRDVTFEHVPVSLRPLILGVRAEGSRARDHVARRSLVVRDRATDELLGEISLAAAGTLPLKGGELLLFRTIRCRNFAAPVAVRWWRYALAWVHARRAPSRGDGLRMSASDLRCLNVYYMSPRPVYLIGVVPGTFSTLFTMSLVDSAGLGEVLLALPVTSPEIELMEQSGVLTMSAAPADRLAEVSTLGAYHRAPNVDASTPALPVRRSPHHGLPVLSQEFTRELSVRATHRIGSHVLFVCRVDAEQGTTPRRMAHISLMYAEWLARRGRPVDALAPD
jgi:flavin reductase (DIM6/NTAB) family NADH-FMN oxidoreductase RutF